MISDLNGSLGSRYFLYDLPESIIHSHRQLIHVRRFTSVHLVNGGEVIVSKFNFFYFKVERVCSFVYCNGVCKSGLSSIKTKFE